MDCTFIRLYLDAYERGHLDPKQREGIRDHLIICSDCGKELEEIRAINAMFEEPIPSLPKDFTQRVMARIAESGVHGRDKNIWQEFGKWGASFIAAGLIMLLLNFTSFGSEINTFIANIEGKPIKIHKIVEYNPVNIINRGLEHINQLLENFENRR